MPAGRLAAVDIGRGLALCGMALFHLDWDLAFLHWRDAGPESSPPWIVFGHLVAGSFLALSGFSLVLAEPKGLGTALRRLAILAAAALTVTAVTRWLFPQDYIFFGILHCIAVSNLLALMALRAPVALLLLGAVFAAAAPLVLGSAWFDGPGWWWLGLSKGWPTTLDYRPLLPWLGCVLLGVAAARLSPARPRTLSPPSRGWLAWAGRHSLALYLVHQPVLLGILMLAQMVHPMPQAETAAALLRECRSQCEAAGGGIEGCGAGCACLHGNPARRLGLPGGPVTLHPVSPDQELDAQTACFGAAAPVRGPAGDAKAPAP